jgi:hypothetical protein
MRRATPVFTSAASKNRYILLHFVATTSTVWEKKASSLGLSHRNTVNAAMCYRTDPAAMLAARKSSAGNSITDGSIR